MPAEPTEPEEESCCKLCDVLVPTLEQHFMRLTSPLTTRSYLLCADCWISYLYEVDGPEEVIDL